MQQYKYLIVPWLAYAVAHIIKYLVSSDKKGSFIDKLFQSGGMPSAHTAFTVSLATLVAINQGLDSVSFAIILALTSIVVYDAVNVRRTVGDYADVIKRLSAGKNTSKKRIHYSQGHSIVEIAGGIVCGIAVALFVQYIF